MQIVPTVHCECNHDFCFGCSLNDHQPAPCALVKMWLKKCEDDSETANWISANTKECPKCNSTIEKNGGCNHMTCRKCRHEFCWMCMGVWSEHGTSWYNCNRFEEKSGSEARDAQAKSRMSLERYLHYYNRYANHEQSAKLDKDIYLKTEKKMQQLQNTTGKFPTSQPDTTALQPADPSRQECRGSKSNTSTPPPKPSNSAAKPSSGPTPSHTTSRATTSPRSSRTTKRTSRWPSKTSARCSRSQSTSSRASRST